MYMRIDLRSNQGVPQKGAIAGGRYLIVDLESQYVSFVECANRGDAKIFFIPGFRKNRRGDQALMKESIIRN